MLRSAAAWIVSGMLFAAAVASPFAGLVARSDASGCVDPHAMEYLLMVFGGAVGGLGLRDRPQRAAAGIARALLPDSTDRRRAAAARGGAILAILFGMAAPILWTVPSLNQFLDAHRPIRVEVDVLLYGMGILMQSSWRVVLGNRGWIGLIATTAAALMVISGTLTSQGWCQ